MKAKGILGVAVLLLIAVCSAILLARILTRPTWNEFSSVEGGFHVLMLGSPKEEDAEGGQLHGYRCQSPSNVSYMVVYLDVPEAELKKDTPGFSGKFLDAASVGLEDKFKGKFQSAQRITLGEHPGREVEIASSNSTGTRVRVYLVNNRYYQLIAQGPNDALHSDETVRFFASFKLAS